MWFYFALLSAVTNAAGTIARRTHGSSARPVELAWWCQLVMVPISALLLWPSRRHLWTSHDFLIPILAASTLYAFATVLLFVAYKHSQISIVTPLGNLLPAGLLVSSFIMFGTRPPITGLLGVLLVVIGIYYSSVSGRHKLWQPFTALWQHRGSRAMLCVVALWAIATNLDKIALRSLSPAGLVFFEQVIDLTLFSMYLVTRRKQYTGQVWHRWWRNICVMAVATVLSVYFEAKAIVLLGNTSYVLAIKRLDVLLVLVYSGFVLKEKHLRKRLAGSLIALVGVVTIYLIS